MNVSIFPELVDIDAVGYREVHRHRRPVPLIHRLVIQVDLFLLGLDLVDPALDPGNAVVIDADDPDATAVELFYLEADCFAALDMRDRNVSYDVERVSGED